MLPAQTKSEFNVEIIRVDRIERHPNADRLGIVKANGVPVVVNLADVQIGDLMLYVPIDALVPLSDPAFAFLAKGSKPNATHARIRAIRLRGVYSEGLLVPIPTGVAATEPVVLNAAATELIGISKYLPPADRKELLGGPPRTRERSRLEAQADRIMPVYGVDSGRRHPDAIAPGTPVVLTEKIHGCNARYVFTEGKLWVGSHKTLRGVTRHVLVENINRAWLRLRRALGFPKRTDLFEAHGDVWWKVAEQYNLKERLQHPWAKGLVFYGEIYGNGLQKRGGVSFDYDTRFVNYGFRVFDIYDPKTKTFLSYNKMRGLCVGLELGTAPLIYVGDFEPLFTESLTRGKTALGNGHIREGVVVRTDVDTADPNRRVLKFVSEDYKLLGAEDDKDE